MSKVTLEVVLLREGTQWVAVNMGDFLVAQGPTMEDAVERLKLVYQASASLTGVKAQTPPEYRYDAEDIWLVDVEEDR